MVVTDQLHILRAACHGKTSPVPNEQEVGWAPGSLDLLPGNEQGILGCPAHSLIATMNKLSQVLMSVQNKCLMYDMLIPKFPYTATLQYSSQKIASTSEIRAVMILQAGIKGFST